MLKRLLTAALVAAGVLIPLAYADTLTDNLLLNKQTVGGNINTWGTNLNSNFQLIDDRLGKVTTINTTGGSTTLSQAQELAQVIKVTGTLVSNVTLNFSGRGGIWIVDNQTSGSFTVTAKVTGQTGVEIVQGEDAIVYSTTTDIASPISIPASVVGVGTVTDYAGTTAPSGWLLAYGQCVSTTTYAALYATFGNSDIYDTAADCGAGLFKIPDLRGRVVAGQDDMGGTSANRLVDGTDSLNGDTLGDTGGVEFQAIAEGELPAHTHSLSASGTTASGGSHSHTFSGTTSSDGDHTHSYSDRGSGSTGTSGGGNNVANTNSDSKFTGSNGAHTHTYSGTTSTASAHTHTVTVTGTSGATGSGTPMSVVQPTIILNKIIYTGV